MTRTATLIAAAFVAFGLQAQAAVTPTAAATESAAVRLALDPGPDWRLMPRDKDDTDACRQPEACEELAMRSLR